MQITASLTFGFWAILLGVLGFLYCPILFGWTWWKVERIIRSGVKPTRREIELIFASQGMFRSPEALIIPTMQSAIIGMIFGIIIDSVISYIG